MDKRKLLNRDSILQVEEVKPGLAARVLEIFLNHAPARYQACKQGLAEADWQAVEKAAHNLRSSAGQLGAEHLLDVCMRLEALAEKGNTQAASAKAAAETVAAEFESIYALTIAEVKREKDTWLPKENSRP
jgi:HPt (histidine-containing phosphotransfer) domain-containing protein